MEFSVLISVYKNETVEHFKQSINSVLNQTVKPAEIVLIRDGEVGAELQQSIDEYLTQFTIFNYVPLEENVGLGNALKIGVEKASNELIARMDTDDISVPNRFELQLKEYEVNPDLDVVGSPVVEFVGDVSNQISTRSTPNDEKEISKFIKKRNPFNHGTVMMKKSAVIAAGNYIEMHFVEDYYLWCRMLLNGCKFKNILEPLVYMRVSDDMYARRGGYAYFKALKQLEKFKRKNKIIGFFEYLKNISIRFAQCILLPTRLRGWAYKKFARKQQKEGN